MCPGLALQVMMPYFSIIVPTFNRSTKIRWTIDSVLAQDARDWELLVISDGSTDDTEAVVRSYSDSRVHLVTLPENSGHPSSPRNTGLELARGQVVCYLDHDDAYRPQHLSILRSAYEGQGAQVVATGAQFLTADPREPRCTSVLDLVWHREIQTLGPIFQPTQVSMRREVARAVGLWTAERIGLEDWDMWLRLALAEFSFYVIGEHTVEITRSSSSRSHQLPVKWQVPLGHAQTSEQTQELATCMQSPRAFAEATRITLAEAAHWYESLWAEGLVVPVSPGGEPMVSDAAHLVRMVKDQPVPFPWPPLRAVPRSDGSFDVGIDLLTVDRRHSQLAVDTINRRFPRKLALVRTLMKEAGLDLVA